MRRWQYLCAVALLLGVHQSVAAERETVITPTEANHELTVTDVRSHDGAISGVVVNKSAAAVRDVKLLIDDVWHWKNERHPGDASPGTAEFFTVPGEIPPGASQSFSYQGHRLPDRADGYFETQVSVDSFTEVGISGFRTSAY